MGEIAEAMLDGTLCSTCGVYVGDPVGFPQYCSTTCEPPEAARARRIVEATDAKPLSCQVDGCGKRFATAAAKRSHRRMKHGLAK